MNEQRGERKKEESQRTRVSGECRINSEAVELNTNTPADSQSMLLIASLWPVYTYYYLFALFARVIKTHSNLILWLSSVNTVR